MLVVVEDRNAHAFLELLFNIEALGRLDVFQVDAAERRLHGGNHVDQLVRVILGQFDVEDVDAGEFLEQAALAFHDRLGGQRADVAKTEHGRAVGDDADQVGARGHFGSRRRIFDDQVTGCSNTRRVGQGRSRWLVSPWSGGRKSCRGWPAMVFECGFAQILFHEISLVFGYRENPVDYSKGLASSGSVIMNYGNIYVKSEPGKPRSVLLARTPLPWARLKRLGKMRGSHLAPAGRGQHSKTISQRQAEAAWLGRMDMAVEHRCALARQLRVVPVLDVVLLAVEQVIHVECQLRTRGPAGSRHAGWSGPRKRNVPCCSAQRAGTEIAQTQGTGTTGQDDRG